MHFTLAKPTLIDIDLEGCYSLESIKLNILFEGFLISLISPHHGLYIIYIRTPIIQACITIKQNKSDMIMTPNVVILSSQ